MIRISGGEPYSSAGFIGMLLQLCGISPILANKVAVVAPRAIGIYNRLDLGEIAYCSDTLAVYDDTGFQVVVYAGTDDKRKTDNKRGG